MESHGDLMTVKDAAERANISGTTQLTMINSGYIKQYMLDKHGLVYYLDLFPGSCEIKQYKMKH